MTTGRLDSERRPVVLADGCFWGIRKAQPREDGVLVALVRYTRGQNRYRNGGPHAAAVDMVCDPAQVAGHERLELFFEI